jgi:hypothetical protein
VNAAYIVLEGKQMNGCGMKAGNEYAQAFERLYATIPKAVFAAVAYLFAMRLNKDQPDKAVGEFLNEWRILHQQGIVPQKPATVER